MNSEIRVAKNNRDYFTGFELVDCRNVLIPGYRLTIEATIREHGQLKAIEEFVLRSVDAEMTEVGALSKFLGLDLDFLSHITEDLEIQGLLNIARQTSATEINLTHQGEKFLAEGQLTKQKSTIVKNVFFDRLTWSPSDLEFIHERDIESANEILCLVRSKKKTGVIAKELAPSSVEEALQGGSRTSARQWNVVSVSKVIKRQKVVYPAHLLIYISKAEGAKDTRIALAIDEKISESHTNFINAEGGIKWLGLSFDFVDTKREAEAIASRVGLHPSSVIQDFDPSSPPKIRYLKTIQLRDQFVESLTTAEKRLVVISAFLKRSVVNRALISRLESLARSGVMIHIGYGLGESTKEIHPEAEALLKELSRNFDNVHIARLGDTHEKFLLVDDQVTVGSFNYLSYSGGDAHIRDEGGLTCPIDSLDRYAEIVSETIAKIEEKPIEGSRPLTVVDSRNGQVGVSQATTVSAEKKALYDKLVKVVTRDPGISLNKLGAIAKSAEMVKLTPSRGNNYWEYTKLSRFLEEGWPGIFEFRQDESSVNTFRVFLNGGD